MADLIFGESALYEGVKEFRGNSVSGIVTVTHQGTGTILRLLDANGTEVWSCDTDGLVTMLGTFTVTATGLVSNLNADYLDNQHGAYYRDASNLNAGLVAVARGGTNLGSYSAGDLLYASATGTLSALAVGTSSQILLGGATPSWGQVLNAQIGTGAAIAWSKVDKTGSSLADLTTRSASDLSSGNLPYAQMPTGNGTWDVGVGNTLVLARATQVSGAADFFSTVTVTGNLTIDTNTFFVDASTNKVGIRTITPNQALEINRGDLRFTQEAAPGACTAALAGAGAGNVPNGSYTYKITLITAEGETAGGTQSNSVTVSDNAVDGKINLTSIPTGTTGVVTSRKIYRSVDGATHKFLATINDNTTTTYQDNLASTSTNISADNTTAGGLYVGGTKILQLGTVAGLIASNVIIQTSVPGTNATFRLRNNSGADAIILGGAVGQALFSDGDKTTPGLAFTGDTDTGIYRGGSGLIGISGNDTLLASFNAIQTVMNFPIRGASGSVGAPFYSFAADTDTGIYRYGVDTLGVAASGIEIARFETTAISTSKALRGPSFDATGPTFGFQSETNLGMYRGGAGILSFGVGNAEQFRVVNGGVAGGSGGALLVTNSLTVTGVIAVGTTPATAGTVRIPRTGTVSFRNVNNDANITALSVDSGNVVILGDAGQAALINVGGILDVQVDSAVRFRIGNPDATLTSSGRLRWTSETIATALDSPAVNLYRSAASVLKTDGSLTVGYKLAVIGALPNNGTAWLDLSGGTLGSIDYYVYRSSSAYWRGDNTLRTTALDIAVINNTFAYANNAAATIQFGTNSTTPTAQTIKGSDSVGTDIVGGDLNIAPGRGTGSGAGGSLYFQTALAGASGTGVNALANRWQMTADGHLLASANNVYDIGNGTTNPRHCYLSGSVVVSGSGQGLRTNTTDGSDNKSLVIAGGGAFGTSRGALMQLYGNEAIAASGFLLLDLGNVSGSRFKVRTTGGTVDSMVVTDTGFFGLNVTPTQGFHQLAGGLRLQQLAIPIGLTVSAVGATGTTSYAYGVVAEDRRGGQTIPTVLSVITNGNATLDENNYNQVSWTAVAGAVKYHVLKTDTSTKLGETTSTSLNDTGQSTSGFTPVGYNTSGDALLEGRLTIGAPSVAPADANIQAGQMSFWYDESSNTVQIRIRRSDTTYRTASISTT